MFVGFVPLMYILRTNTAAAATATKADAAPTHCFTILQPHYHQQEHHHHRNQYWKVAECIFMRTEFLAFVGDFLLFIPKGAYSDGGVSVSYRSVLHHSLGV